MPITATNDARGKDVEKTTAPEDWANNEEVYTTINKEIAALVGDADRIVFGPALDFEYKAPLEDFKNRI
ncbi:MAG: hypothetical protein AAB869_03110 [Patescibacteria group bacterium]